MLLRFGQILMMVAILAAAGVQWTMLQSVAWTTMLATNLRTHSLAVAVENAFDGQHPCCLCKAIAKARKTEKKNEYSPQLKKFEFPPLERSFVLVAPAVAKLNYRFAASIKSIAHSPPTPPPISIPA